MSSGRVLIVGGGIGGVTAALCFAQQGIDVDVFEQASDFGEIGAGIQLSPNCNRVLHELGLESELRSAAFLPEGTEMRDWKSGKLLASTALGNEVVGRYGMPYYHIHRADLMSVLSNAARNSSKICLHTNSHVDGFKITGANVSVEVDGGIFEGDLLVGADGIHSIVRAQLFGEKAPTFTGNVAWRSLVPAERLSHGLVPPVAAVWWGPGSHFVHYYVRGGDLVNCVCVVEKEGWEVESWTERGDHNELKSDFAGWHGTIQTLIDNMDRDACFKWALFDRPPMDVWSEGRATLLGDACHPTLPFMAQGAAMSIEDGAVLARCVASGGDIEASLKKYESLRRERTARVQTGSRRNASIFHARGMKAIARNAVAKRAGGKTLDWIFKYDPLSAHLA